MRRPPRLNPALAGLAVPVAKLRPDPENARAHPARSIEALKESLRRFGQQRPVVCRPDGTVVAGSGMLEAARQLGWKELAAVTYPGSEVEAVGYAIADNRTAELSTWDWPKLKAAIASIGEAVGFTDEEVESLEVAQAPPVTLPDEESTVSVRVVGVSQAHVGPLLEAVEAALDEAGLEYAAGSY